MSGQDAVSNRVFREDRYVKNFFIKSKTVETFKDEAGRKNQKLG